MEYSVCYERLRGRYVSDDLLSMTGASSAIYPGDCMSGLDNEVEMLYFAAGSMLVKAGEVFRPFFFAERRVDAFKVSSLSLTVFWTSYYQRSLGLLKLGPIGRLLHRNQTWFTKF